MRILDARRTTRYIAEPPLPCRFGREQVAICNFGQGGVQIEHDDPLGARRGTFSAQTPVGVPLEFSGEVIWSQLLPSSLEPGRYRYRSGVRLDSDARHDTERVFDLIVDAGRARPDTESLERKRQALARRAATTQSQFFLRPVSPSPQVAPEVLKRIADVHARLSADTEERARWEALAFASLIRDPARRERYRDALAVWEYLDQEIDLEIVARVLRTLA